MKKERPERIKKGYYDQSSTRGGQLPDVFFGKKKGLLVKEFVVWGRRNGKFTPALAKRGGCERR